jgi:hypothetical protein
VSSGFPSATAPAGRRGKTVQIRRGAAAVIGQAPEPTSATVPGQGRAWEGGSGTVTSRKPEDLLADPRSVLRTQAPDRHAIRPYARAPRELLGRSFSFLPVSLSTIASVHVRAVFADLQSGTGMIGQSQRRPRGEARRDRDIQKSHERAWYPPHYGHRAGYRGGGTETRGASPSRAPAIPLVQSAYHRLGNDPTMLQ